MAVNIPINKEALTPSAVDKLAMGPRVDFLQSWSDGWDAQERASATYGIEEAMRELDAEQYRSMKDAGIENAPKLSDAASNIFEPVTLGPVMGGSTYLDTARFYVDGGTQERAAYLQEYDDRIEAIRKENPNLSLRSSRDIFEEVQKRAQDAEYKASESRRTVMGHVANFISGGVASMNPRTDPFNFMTLPAGGVGKGAVTRIASQAGVQGGIETINQLTGVQEQRRLLGLDNGFWDGATRVLGAAAGGAVLQGFGEGISAAGRRFFRNTDIDPAPSVLPEAPKLLEYKPLEGAAGVQKGAPPMGPFDTHLHEVSPFSTSRTGKSRTVIDLDYVANRLDKWDGELPYAMRPKTDTAIPNTVDTRFALDAKAKDALTRNINDIAREVDPKLFKQYDKLAARKNTYRTWLEEMGAARNKTDVKLVEMQNKLDELDSRIDSPSTSARNKKRYVSEREQLLADMKTEAAKVSKNDTPDMARVRKELIDTDVKMRELAPAVSRAYARAQERWDLGFEERELIRTMMKEGRTELPYRNPLQGFDYDEAVAFPKTLQDKAPILRQADKVKGITPDMDAVDVSAKIIEENAKVINRALDNFRAEVSKFIDPETKEVYIPGTDKKMELDKDFIIIGTDEANEPIKKTIREIMQEINDIEEDLKAVSVCSIR